MALIPEWTPAEQAQLAACEAIGYRCDGVWSVVRLDALPTALASLVRQQERDEARKAAKETLRKSAPRGVKVSKAWAKAKGLL